MTSLMGFIAIGLAILLIYISNGRKWWIRMTVGELKKELLNYSDDLEIYDDAYVMKKLLYIREIHELHGDDYVIFEFNYVD